MVEGGEGDGRRIENRNAIILSTALFTGEKRTIADPAAPIFIVVNLAARMCWSRVVSRWLVAHVPRGFVAVGHEPCERDPCQNWIRWIRSVPRTSCRIHAPPSWPPAKKSSWYRYRNPYISFQTFPSVPHVSRFFLMRQKWSNVKFKRSIIIRREYADEAPFCFVPVSRSLAENRTFKATR